MKKSKIEKTISSQIEREKNLDSPELKKSVFNSLDTLELLGEMTELFSLFQVKADSILLETILKDK